MQAASGHFLMLVFAAVIARLGWYMAHNPTRTLRFFTFGTEPAFGHKFGVAWCRIGGWFFAVGGSLGVLLYLVLLPMDFWRSL
jgi:cytochrome b561